MKYLLLLFIIALISINAIAQCGSIKKEIDKFTGKTTYYSPILKRLSYTKIITSKDTVIYANVHAPSLSYMSGRGITFLLDNGEKLYFDEEIKVSVNSNAQYENSAFFRLSDSDIETLLIHKIIDIRIYVIDFKLTSPDKFYNYFMCIIK